MSRGSRDGGDIAVSPPARLPFAFSNGVISMFNIVKRGLVWALCIVGMTIGTSSAALAGEALRYRHTQQQSIHLDDPDMAKSYEQSLKALGVATRLDSHGHHYDLTYQCREWVIADFRSHAEAAQWERWLISLGFETHHEH